MGITGSDGAMPTVVFIATVSATVHHFLRPYAADLRSLGWRVEAAASGMTDDVLAGGSFDGLHDLPLSRSIRDISGIARGERAVAALIDEIRPDIIHVHTPIASFVTRLAARRTPSEHRPAVVYTAHGFHFHEGGGPLTNQLYRMAERLAGRWTDRLIVINDEDERAATRHRIVPAGHLVRMRGIGLDTTAIAPAAIGPPAAAAARRRIGVPADVDTFVIVGELNDNKRQGDAIAALAAMRVQTAHLVIVGAGPTLLRLQAEAARLEVASRVHFAGYLADVPAVVAGATALVATSAREGLSRSVMEALALEVPVVASAARGNRELVANDGWIVAIGDVGALAEKMDWMSEHPAERREMGRRARARMIEGYDIHELVRRHRALYLDILAQADLARRSS